MMSPKDGVISIRALTIINRIYIIKSSSIPTTTKALGDIQNWPEANGIGIALPKTMKFSGVDNVIYELLYLGGIKLI